MQPVALTRTEIVNVLTRKVRHFEGIGLERDAAVLQTACVFKTEPRKVANLIRSADEDRD